MKRDSLRNLLLLVLVLAVVGLYLYVSVVKSPSDAQHLVVIQDKPQEWADALKLGLYEGLRELGLKDGVDLVITHRSAAGDPQGLTTLAQAVSKQKPTVIYTLGSQASQAVFNATHEIPIVFGAVTDPIKVKFYNGSLDRPNANITGTQDEWPYSAQFDLVLTLVPSAKTIGVVYNLSEINSQVSMHYIRTECEKRNLEILERNVTEESQVLASVEGLLNAGINVFFIPADNTAQTSAKIIITACMRKKVPVFTGIPGIVEHGALGTVGTNYYELGKLNAHQIAEILRGRRASDIPVRVADKGDLYINIKAARDLGIVIPDDLRKRAFKTYE